MRVKQHRVLMPRCVRDADSLCSKGFQEGDERADIQDLIALILHLEGLSDLEPMPPECRKDIALVIVECFPDSTENSIDILGILNIINRNHSFVGMKDGNIWLS